MREEARFLNILLILQWLIKLMMYRFLPSCELNSGYILITD